jgi:hypothetical protein
MSDQQMDKTLYRLRSTKTGLYYSPRSTGPGWNTEGKFLTRRQLSQVPARTNKETIIEVWGAQFLDERTEI